MSVSSHPAGAGHASLTRERVCFGVFLLQICSARKDWCCALTRYFTIKSVSSRIKKKAMEGTVWEVKLCSNTQLWEYKVTEKAICAIVSHK